MKRQRSYQERLNSKNVVFWIVGIFFFLYSLTYIYTFSWAFISSLKDKLEFMREPMAFPKKLHFENYLRAFETLEVNQTSLIGLIFNSIWFAGGYTAINIFVTVCTAYCVAKYTFPGRDLIYSLALITMLFTFSGSLPAVYDLLGTLNLLDTPLYIITASSGLGFNFLLLYGFYKGVSWEYAEAAFVDGANHYDVFFKIMLPHALPMCAALGIVGFIGLWNDYLTPLMFLQGYPTMASGLYLFQYEPKIRADYPLYYACIFIATLPVVIIYASFQEMIMTNTVAGGLKG
ncbi:MAG: carbohydrate ABC transporter permease [Clostridiales bacterium]|nr:carbohydrate ABC transporter permease [Clostridiales bacterium]